MKKYLLFMFILIPILSFGQKRAYIDSIYTRSTISSSTWTADRPSGQSWTQEQIGDSLKYNYNLYWLNSDYAKHFGITGSQKTFLYQSSVDSTIYVYSHLGGDIWRKIVLTNSGRVGSYYTPHKVTEQSIQQILGYALVKDAVTYGSWNIYNSTDSSPYIGHQIANNATTNDSITFTIYGSGDIYFAYWARDNSGIVNVKVDGVSYGNFDLYSAISTYKSEYLIGRNFSDGSHIVTIINTGTKNASSSYHQCYIDAIILKNNNTTPNDDSVYPKLWEPSTSYDAYDEVLNTSGRAYVTTAGGTSGTTMPTHSSGTVSDGGVSWTALAVSSFSFYQTIFQAAGSELEYAYNIKPDSQSAYVDVGGNVHGNEYDSSGVKFYLNGLEETVALGTWASAENISIRQVLKSYYDTPADSAISTVIQIHEIDKYSMRLRYKLTWNQGVTVRWFYNAMWPLLTYNGPKSYKILKTFKANNISINLPSYENDSSNPEILLNKSLVISAYGRGFANIGSSGVPDSLNGRIGLTLSLSVTPESMNYFSNSLTKSYLAANVNTGQYTGYSSWLSKIYFKLPTDITYSIGDVIEVEAEYKVLIKDNYIDLGTL